MNIKLDPESIFDVQVKRIHEYKRQMLFAFYIISQYLQLKNNPKEFIYPRTFIDRRVRRPLPIRWPN